MKKRLRRIVALLLAFTVSFGMVTVSEAAQESMTVSVSSEKGLPGNTVDVVIQLTDNPGVAGVTFDIEYSEEYKQYVLKKSKAGRKDQSYVLWNIPKELLEHIVFPLGDFETKDQIRKIAKDNNLKVATKPDSEDICFIPDGNYKKFLEENSEIKPKPGNIVNKEGKKLGTHRGLYNYTIGQRKGLGISYSEPLFVIGFNSLKNQVIVGTEKELYTKSFKVNEINLLLFDKIEEEMEVDVKTRYSTNTAKATIRQIGDEIEVNFNEPQRAITPGQSAVFYIGDVVVGGGKII